MSCGQFELFMSDATYPDKEKPEKWKGVDKFISPTAEHPAQMVSWYDAVMYCNWLSLHEGRKPCYERTGTKEKGFQNDEHDGWRLTPGDTGYRLVSEAEWEYACRAGTQTVFSMGSDEMMLTKYCQMFPSKLAAVCGTKIPNAWGLHDVHGNVEERIEGQKLYGGSWMHSAESCSSGQWAGSSSSNRNNWGGFRVALSPSVKSPEAE